MKILIVEDEPSLREIMVRTLTREQYIVEQAADYAAALDKIAAYDYDCILLDIMLPGGSGLRLLEELKRRRSPAAVILHYFMSRPNHTVDKTALAEGVWGDHIDQADNFDFVYAQMKNLRRKLHDAGADIEIRAVYGFGYKLVQP